MSELKIGWGEVSIVPEGRVVNLAGQFYERITREVETPITVTALAIESGDDAVIFCSCDLVSTSSALLAGVRERLVGSGIPTDKIIISAIHTHTAMSYGKRSDSVMAGRPDAKKIGGLDVLRAIAPELQYEKLASYEGADLLDGDEAFDFLADRIAAAVRTAWESRSAGLYAQGFGRAAVGMCRRVCYDDGSAKMWGDTDLASFTELEGGNDSGIELLFTYTPDKRLTGAVINVACPAQVLEHRSFISSDYFGKLKALLRREYGEDFRVLGIVSAAGDQCPRDMIRWVEPETPINDPNIVRNNPTLRVADPSMFDVSGCDRVARRIATEVLAAAEEVREYYGEGLLCHESMILDIPVRRVTPAEMELAREKIEAFAKEAKDRTINYVDKARLHIHAGVIARYEAQQEAEVYPIEIHVVRLGNVAFATNPYELFLDYGNQIRARSHAQQTFLIQLACGSFGYLPTEKAEKGSHYSAYVSSGTTGHVGGDLLVRKTVSTINRLMEK